jgi:hypothetical protein
MPQERIEEKGLLGQLQLDHDRLTVATAGLVQFLDELEPNEDDGVLITNRDARGASEIAVHLTPQDERGLPIALWDVFESLGEGDTILRLSLTGDREGFDATFIRNDSTAGTTRSVRFSTTPDTGSMSTEQGAQIALFPDPLAKKPEKLSDTDYLRKRGFTGVAARAGLFPGEHNPRKLSILISSASWARRHLTLH